MDSHPTEDKSHRGHHPGSSNNCCLRHHHRGVAAYTHLPRHTSSRFFFDSVSLVQCSFGGAVSVNSCCSHHPKVVYHQIMISQRFEIHHKMARYSSLTFLPRFRDLGTITQQCHRFTRPIRSGIRTASMLKCSFHLFTLKIELTTL